MMLGSEQALIQKSKDLLGGKTEKKPQSPFKKDSFQTYQADKFKDLLFNDGAMMDDFLDQIEVAVAKKSENQKKALKKQLERKKISQSTFTKKQRELEKWVTAERREINEKRRKVKDTCQEIGGFMAKIEKDKQLVMEGLNSAGSTPRGLRKSISQNSVSQVSASVPGLEAVQEQLRGLKGGQIGGAGPETKYINKKREFVRELMREKKEAIEKGVKERMGELESDMVDEMMQAALGLDVETEI